MTRCTTLLNQPEMIYERKTTAGGNYCVQGQGWALLILVIAKNSTVKGNCCVKAQGQDYFITNCNFYYITKKHLQSTDLRQVGVSENFKNSNRQTNKRI